jgi:glutathione S-transferase
MELGYWGIKGLAEGIRLTLALFNLPHTEKNPQSLEEALALTRNTGFDFPNMPYLIDGDIRITESSAIPIYLAQKAGKKDFFGKEGIEQVRHQSVIGVLDDILKTFLDILFKDNFESLWETGKPTFERKLKELSVFLGEKTLLFDNITYADVKLFITCQFISIVARSLKKPDVFADLKNLVAHNEHFSKLPGVKEYLETDPRVKFPLVPPHRAKFPILE